MYVICFYWQGDRWQQDGYSEPEGHTNDQQKFINRAGMVADDLPSRYVNNLFHGVTRFADRPFQFVCFTNQELGGLNNGIEVRELPMYTEDGVLPRVFMFSREAGLFGHQVLCLDLDVVIVGSLKKLMAFDGTFCARSKFKPGETHKLDGDVMSFKADIISEDIFWKPFIKDIAAAEQLTQGRERYWVRHVAGDTAERWDEHAPGAILSYKRHVRGRRVISPHTAIISCHGIPRPHQIKDNLINQYWK